MSGNRAMRRALETTDAVRTIVKLPLIQDETVMVTPEMAREMLQRNQRNRPVNWSTVSKYVAIMKAGKWLLHAQGIILDTNGNILTGQKRLWAVVLAGVAMPFRVSRGSPPDTAKLIDRGQPQSARDLATRDTERKHSPVESSIARAHSILYGVPKPSVDQLSELMVSESDVYARMLREVQGTRKTRSILMVLAAIAFRAKGDADAAATLAMRATKLAEQLANQLQPETADGCWGKGAAFGLAMKAARDIVDIA